MGSIIEGRIIGSARLSLIEDISTLYLLGIDISTLEIPSSRPFAYFSRLVIHNDFRGIGLSKLLVIERIKRFQELDIFFGLTEVREERLTLQFNFGFKRIGNVISRENPEEELLNLLILYLKDIKSI